MNILTEKFEFCHPYWNHDIVILKSWTIGEDISNELSRILQIELY